ncbi:MAG TPA: Holliday junction resolvase RuvX [Clostridiales bacterium]|nr:Holliday junction resolvase RuvX [Clostridiales bacterium]HBZ78144.1 Holliday junction resolvase RuvX [Clostridiales bacterium]
MSRVMAIDFGMRRIGVAVSDPLRIMASGLETINWNGVDSDYAIDRLAEIVNEMEITEIVLGRPSRTDGTVSESEEKAVLFGKLLEEKVGIKPSFRDERYTTVIASRFLRSTGVSGKNKKKVVDQVAAEIILQEYLDISRK